MTSQNDRIEQLEKVVEQMLRPIRGVPFDLVIKAFSGFSVISVDPDDEKDQKLLASIAQAAHDVRGEIVRSPINRPRANEVGNDIEPFVRSALLRLGFEVEIPKGKSGRRKTTGYPDFLLTGPDGRRTYLECKTFSEANADTTFRAFYLSPSDDFKVGMDARHLLLDFEMVATPVPSGGAAYVPVRAKLISLENLLCDVKYEFNASNRRLYRQSGSLFDIGLA